MDSEVIGYSVRGRPLVVRFHGRAAHPRVLILAGQHGDEGEAREAAAACLSRSSSICLEAARLAIVTDANPDGAAAATRRNAWGIDLNRDHLLLSAPETLAVHRFVNRWRPDLIVDVHTYRPWRPELLRHGFVFPQDVMIDIPTNPAIRVGWPDDAGHRLLEFVTRRMAQSSFRSDRYTLVRPSGIVRHSNLDIVDARNGFALRYGVPTVLLEGRRSFPDDPPIFAPPHVALQRSIEAVVEWAGMHSDLLRRPPADACRATDLLAVRCQNAHWRSSTRRMEMQSASQGDIRIVDVPGQYLPAVKTTGTVRQPRAYGVHRGCHSLLNVLARHGFETAGPAQFPRAVLETCREPFIPERNLNGLDHLPARVFNRVTQDLDEFLLFPADQAGGRTLALLLDPESQFGAYRFAELGLEATADSAYPIVRII